MSHFVHEKNKVKITNVKNNCIARIKIMNKIQCIKTHKSYDVLLFISIKHTQNNWIAK